MHEESDAVSQGCSHILGITGEYKQLDKWDCVPISGHQNDRQLQGRLDNEYIVFHSTADGPSANYRKLGWITTSAYNERLGRTHSIYSTEVNLVSLVTETR